MQECWITVYKIILTGTTIISARVNKKHLLNNISLIPFGGKYNVSTSLENLLHLLLCYSASLRKKYIVDQIEA
jgi:hypothetical protein